MKNWKIEKLKNQEIEKLRNWEIEKLRNWEIEKLRNWVIKKLRNWEIEKVKKWKFKEKEKAGVRGRGFEGLTGLEKSFPKVQTSLKSKGSRLKDSKGECPEDTIQKSKKERQIKRLGRLSEAYKFFEN